MFCSCIKNYKTEFCESDLYDKKRMNIFIDIDVKDIKAFKGSRSINRDAFIKLCKRYIKGEK